MWTGSSASAETDARTSSSSGFLNKQRSIFPHIRAQSTSERGKENTGSWKLRKGFGSQRVANILGVARNGSRPSVDEGERLPVRPVTSHGRFPAKSSVPMLDISEDVLDRMLSEPKQSPKKASSKFFMKQRLRLDPTRSSEHRIPPSQRSRADSDRTLLNAEDFIYMFAGAPYFSVDDDGERPTPRAVYGWRPVENGTKVASDHATFEHRSFEACSMDIQLLEEKTGSAARPWEGALAEVPSMLGANGNDPGTVGFAHFLQLPLARPAQSLEGEASFPKRDLLRSDPEAVGLRPFTSDQILDRLAELRTVYAVLAIGRERAADWEQTKIEDVGEDLFTTLLSAELGTTPAGTGNVSLKTQISALQDVLGTGGLWYDFTQPEWRFRLGDLLWADRAIHPTMKDEERTGNRDILLLQLVLSGELFVRLKIAQKLSTSGPNASAKFSAKDFEALAKHRVESVKWDLLLFERLMECFRVTWQPADANNSQLRPVHFTTVSFEAAKKRFAGQESDVVFQPRREEHQLEGVLHFARTLGWSDLDDLMYHLTLPLQLSPERPASVISEYGTPMSTPRMSGTSNSSSDRNSGKSKNSLAERLPIKRTNTAQYVQLFPTASFKSSPGNQSRSWLSRSWMSGLILPGDVASKLLMATMLENSPKAISALGSSADLNGGFIYQKRMYWSKRSVIGRVLAATEQARECMGWISTSGVPRGQTDAWIDPVVQDPPFALNRIEFGSAVADQSDPLHFNDPAQVQAGDFTYPIDGHQIMGNEALFHKISLTPATTPDESISPSYTVGLTFISPTNPRVGDLTIPLTHSVHFVSSYPCYPPKTRLQRNPPPLSAHDSVAATDSGRVSPISTYKEKELPAAPAHPLHMDYTFTVIPAATLLSAKHPSAQDSVLSMPGSVSDGSASNYQINDEEVAVLDCRGSHDLEALARAWCAKVGENALIGHKSRTCLACCIREAMGLGIGVVIRT